MFEEYDLPVPRVNHWIRPWYVSSRLSTAPVRSRWARLVIETETFASTSASHAVLVARSKISRSMSRCVVSPGCGFAPAAGTATAAIPDGRGSRTCQDRSMDVELREVTDADVEVFYEQQLDPEARRVAVFPLRDHETFT